MSYPGHAAAAPHLGQLGAARGQHGLVGAPVLERLRKRALPSRPPRLSRRQFVLTPALDASVSGHTECAPHGACSALCDSTA